MYDTKMNDKLAG